MQSRHFGINPYILFLLLVQFIHFLTMRARFEKDAEIREIPPGQPSVSSNQSQLRQKTLD